MTWDGPSIVSRISRSSILCSQPRFCENRVPVPASDPSPPPASPVSPVSPAPLDAAAPDADATTRAAGRGGLAIGVAKVSFILFGFAQQLILPRILGVDGYGEISRVLAVVGVVNNVIVASAIQGVSRAVTSVPEDRADEAFRRTLSLHAAVAVIVSTGFALLAGLIADAISAPHITAPLRLVAAVILLYGVYAPLVGALNGRRRFVTQAALDIAYGAMRMVSIAGGALVFLKLGRSAVLGAAAGFVLAATLIVPIAASRTGLGRRGTAGPTTGEHLAFLVPLLISQSFLNLLLQTDFLIFSHFAGDAAARMGLGPKPADELVGVYRGVQLFAFLPYQLLMSVTFILFPMLARAHAEHDREAVRRYTMTGVRIAMLLTGLLCAPIAGLNQHVLRLAYQEAIWSQGGEALRIHALGMGAFAILGILSTALTSLRLERVAATLTGVSVALVAAGCVLAVPLAPFGPRMIVHSAIATGAALALAALVSAFVLRRLAGGVVAPLVPLRVALAVAVTVALGSRLPWISKPVVVVEAAALGLVYLVALVLLGELGRADLATLKRVFSGRRGRERPAP